MDLKLEKEEFAALINRHYRKCFCPERTTVYMLLYQRAEERSCSRLCRSLRKYDRLWIVPYMTGGEYSWLFGIRPERVGSEISLSGDNI
ncbi:MAG: hypothetical protein ACLT33_10865 [Lachnospira pectinoschiza]